MEPLQKIQDYSFSELKNVIERDSKSTDMLAQRYSVRFIMLDNFDTLKELSSFFSDFGVKILRIESLLDDNNDRWITSDEIKNLLKTEKESTFVTPFSEIVRFYEDNDFNGFIEEISMFEDIKNPRKRIYIPLIGMQNRIIGFLQRFSRIQESAPIWRCNTHRQESKVYVTEGLDIPSSNNIYFLKTFFDWLQFWKTAAPQKTVVCSSLPILAYYDRSQPDNIFTFTKLDNAYQFLTELIGLSFPFDYQAKDNSKWNELMKELNGQDSTGFSFSSYVSQRFNMMSIDTGSLLRIWSEDKTIAFDRWLLKYYVLTDKRFDNQPYLRSCLSSENIEDNSDQLYITITEKITFFTESLPTQAFLKERFALISSSKEQMNRYVPQSTQNRLKDVIVDLFQKGNVNIAKGLCTHTFLFEKILAIGWYINHRNDNFPYDDLKRMYPAMAAYLKTENASAPDDQEWAHDYFKHYRMAKIADRLTPDITNQIEEHNSSSEKFYSWYHNFTNCHNELVKSQVKIVYWIDALGAEFIPYLCWLVENNGFSVRKCIYTRADIPSSTHHNRFDLPPNNVFRQLDEIAHDKHGYKQYKTLIDELDCIKRIIETIISNHRGNNEEIAIVSDHGLSCLSRKTESLKYDKSADHEGRYFEVEDSSSLMHDSNYVVHTNESDGKHYKVALNHHSLGVVPTHEVHGGCCPEEVLVPFLVISNTGKTTKYDVSLKKNRIPVSNPILNIYITPKPDDAQIVFSGKKYSLRFQSGNLWNVELENPSQGVSSVDIFIAGNAIDTLDVEFYGVGFSTNIDKTFDF